MKVIKQLNSWHHTRTGYLVFGLVELGLAYGAVSWAIDSGNLLLYLATIILIYSAIYNSIKLTTLLIHGNVAKN